MRTVAALVVEEECMSVVGHMLHMLLAHDSHGVVAVAASVVIAIFVIVASLVVVEEDVAKVEVAVLDGTD